MTNPNYYKRITGSQIQGDAYSAVEPNGTLVVANGGELRLHDGIVAGGNPVGGSGAGNGYELTSGTYAVSLSSSTGILTLSTASTILGQGTDPNVYVETVSSGTTSTWTFGTNGILTLPTNTPIIRGNGTGTNIDLVTVEGGTYSFNTAYFESGNGSVNGVNTGSRNAQYFSCTVTANPDGTYSIVNYDPGNSFYHGFHFGISGADLGGNSPYNDMTITVESADTSTGAIISLSSYGISVGKQYVFDNYGNITVPNNGGITVANTGQLFYLYANGRQFEYQPGITVGPDDVRTEVYRSHAYFYGDGHWDVGSDWAGTKIYSTGTDINNIIVTTNNNQNNWQFGSDGKLTIPGTIYSSSTVSLSVGSASYWWSEMGDLMAQTTSTQGMGVAYDPQGNLWVFGSAIVGGGSPAIEDTISMKYDANGNLLWNVLHVDDSGTMFCASNDVITFDTNGNAYYLANNEFDGYVYIGKMDANGNTVENKLLVIQMEAYDMVIDSSNHLYIVGEYGNDYNHPIVIKVDENYNVIWTAAIYTGDSDSANGYGITLDDSNNVYITGTYDNTSFTFLTQILANGTLGWTKGLYVGQEVYGIEVGYNNGYLYVVAWDGPFTVLSKFDTSGNQIWSNEIGNPALGENGLDINFDSAGYIYISGDGAYNEINGIAVGNLWLAKVDPATGTPVYQRTLSVPDNSLALNLEGGSGPYTPFFYGHRNASIFEDRIAIAGLTYWNNASNTSTTATYVSYSFVAQLPLDGSITGTYNGLTINDVTTSFGTWTVASSYTNTDITTWVTTATSVFVTATTSFNLITSPNTLTAVTYTLGSGGQGGAIWNFNSAGTITFPDGTQQTTAYTTSSARSELINNNHKLKLTSEGAVTIDNNFVLKTNVGNGTANAWFNVYGDNTHANIDFGASSAYDSNGNLYVIGSLISGMYPVGFGVLLKYDTSGNLIWQIGLEADIGGPSVYLGESIVVDADDNIYVVGNSFIEVGTGGFYVQKFNADGNLIAQTSYAIDTGVVASDIAVDTSGNVYVCGVDYGTSSSFVVSLTMTGSINWQKESGDGALSSWGSPGNTGTPINLPTIEGASSIVVKGTHAYVTGQHGNSPSVMYVAKLSLTDGSIVWIKDIREIVNTYNYWGLGIDVDASGNIYAIGGADGDGLATLTKFDTNGNTLWNTYIGYSFAFDVTAADDGYIYLTGNAYENTNLPYALTWSKFDSNGFYITGGEFVSGNEGSGVTWGHRLGGVRNGALAITGYTTESTATTATVTATIITLQVPTDDSFISTTTSYDSHWAYGPLEIEIPPGPNSASTLTLIVTTSTTVTTPSYATSTATVAVGDLSTASFTTLTNSLYTIGVGSGSTATNNQWVFDGSVGSINLPNGGELIDYNMQGGPSPNDLVSLNPVNNGSSNLLSSGDGYSQLMWVQTSTYITGGIINGGYNDGRPYHWIYVDGIGLHVENHTGSASHNWHFNTDGTTQFPAFTITTATGSNGQVLTINGSGYASWQTPVGGGSNLTGIDTIQFNNTGASSISGVNNISDLNNINFRGWSNNIGRALGTSNGTIIINTGTTATIWTASTSYVTSARLTVHAEVRHGTSGAWFQNFDTETTEILVAVRFESNVPTLARMTVIGSVSTLDIPMATYDIQINGSNLIELTCTPTSAMTTYVVTKVEYSESGSSSQENYC